MGHDKIDGLVQDCSNSSALAMELLQSCTKPSKCMLHLYRGEKTAWIRIFFIETEHALCGHNVRDKGHYITCHWQWFVQC